VSNSSPKALHIVLNSVNEDSRVLKCAWTLGNAGWDVEVIGATPFTYSDQLTIGYAKILRLPLKPVVTQAFIARVLRALRYYRRKIYEVLKIKDETTIPNLNRAVRAAAPKVLRFSPDVIHAHDYTALPIAAALVDLLSREGKKAFLVYDAHEYVPGVAHLTKPLAALYSKKERKYSHLSAAVLSVSEPMNDLLIEHLQITTRPVIVANDPLVAEQQPSSKNLRHDCGIGQGVPLMVYSGAVAPQRGIQTALAAMRLMPDVHLALIANPGNQSVKDLVAGAPDLADRFHVLPYVPNAELVSYLSSADIGLIPLLHRLNHEISLITKFGEYMQAKLPILVSDVKTMAAEVQRLGNGEVFTAEDVPSFVAAAKKIFAEPDLYRKKYTDSVLAERSWERQGEVLVSTYNQIAGAIPTARTPMPFTITKALPLQ
jgi:glycosyltransferase involved in cell wall biosynthesis